MRTNTNVGVSMSVTYSMKLLKFLRLLLNENIIDIYYCEIYNIEGKCLLLYIYIYLINSFYFNN